MARLRRYGVEPESSSGLVPELCVDEYFTIKLARRKQKTRLDSEFQPGWAEGPEFYILLVDMVRFCFGPTTDWIVWVPNRFVKVQPANEPVDKDLSES